HIKVAILEWSRLRRDRRKRRFGAILSELFLQFDHGYSLIARTELSGTRGQWRSCEDDDDEGDEKNAMHGPSAFLARLLCRLPAVLNGRHGSIKTPRAWQIFGCRGAIFGLGSAACSPEA